MIRKKINFKSRKLGILGVLLLVGVVVWWMVLGSKDVSSSEGFSYSLVSGELYHNDREFKVSIEPTATTKFTSGNVGISSKLLRRKVNGEGNSKGKSIFTRVFEKKDTAIYEAKEFNVAYEILNEKKKKGLKETIILKEPTAPTFYEFELDLKNVANYRQFNDGSWHFFDKDEKDIFYIPKGEVFDANGKQTTAWIEIVKEDGKDTLTVGVDPQWLEDSARDYPIMIDPSVILSGGFTEAEAQRGGQQRKLVYASGNWYAFYTDATIVFYKKSSDGVTWGSAVTVDSTSSPFAPSVWLEGNLIYVAWLRDTTDAIAVNTINTASSDALGTQCTTGDLGTFGVANTSDAPAITLSDNGTVYVAVGGSSTAIVEKLTFAGCSFTDITTGSGVDTSDNPTLTTIDNNLHVISWDGNMVHSIYDGASWTTSGYFSEKAAQWGGHQRKVVYVNSNWYAFYHYDLTLYYKKSSDGVTWGSAVTIDSSANAPFAPTAWVEGTTIYVAWLQNTTDTMAVNTIDTASADALGTQCTSGNVGSIGFSNSNGIAVNDYPVLAVADNGTVYVANSGSVSVIVQKLTFAGCTFTDITTGSGLTSTDKPTLTTIGNTLHMVFQDGNIAHSIYNGTSWTTSGYMTENEARRGGQQRKVVYVNSNWYAFYNDNSTVYYKKSADGVTWGSAVTIDSTSAPIVPTAWVEGTTIYVAWIRDTTDAIAVNTIDTASADALGTQCTSGDLGSFFLTTLDDFPSLAVVDNGTVYIAVGGNTNAVVEKLTFAGCTFTDITTGSGLTVDDVPVLTTIGNNLHMVFQDGAIAHSIYDGASWTISGYMSETDAQRGGSQRKVVYVNSNWYAFYTDESTVFYKKSADGVTWGSAVTIDSTSIPFAPTAWVEGTTIYVGWERDTGDAIAVNTIDTASADALGTQCTSGDLGTFATTNNGEGVVLAVADNGTVYAAVGAAGTAIVEKLTFAGCTFTNITTGSGLTTSDFPAVTTIGNNLHMVYQDGNISHSIYDGSSWTTSNTTIDTDTETAYSLTTDGTNMWLLTADSSTNAAMYKCTSCATSANWSSITSPWPSGETNLTSVSITYDSSNSDLYAFAIKDTTEQAYYKMSDATSISWGSDTSLGFTADSITGLGHISSPQEGAGTSQIAVTLRNGPDYVFSNLTPTRSIALDLNGIIDFDTESDFSLTTDGTNLWLLTVDSTTTTALYKCTSCASSSSWSVLTSPWPSGLTNLTSVSLTYDSSNSDLYAFAIKDTSEQAYYKMSDATSISWGSDTSLGFTTAVSGLGHISSPQEGAGTSQIGVTLRNGSNYVFSNLTPTRSVILDLNGMIDADTTDSIFSLTTDGTNMWLLTIDTTTVAAMYKCTSCATSANWSSITSPWPSGETNLTSVSLTYDSSNSDLYAFAIKDTTEQAYYKMSDATSISWGSDTSLGFTADSINKLGHISSPQEGAGTSQIGVTLRNGADYVFSNLTPTRSIVLDLNGVIDLFNSDNDFSLTTDGINMWLLIPGSSGNTILYKCTSCASSANWSSITSPWPSSVTNLTAVSLSYDSYNFDLYAFAIKDTSEQAYYKMSDATSISWGSDTSLAFTAGDLGHISSEFSGPPVSAVVRQGANFEFANVLAPLKYLAFTNATRIFATNTCSGASNPFVIEIQSGSGTPTNPTASTVIRVTSNSSGAVVYSDSNCDTPVTNGDFTFETNQSSKTFYVRDTTRGSYTLTGTRQSGDSVISGTHIYGLTIDPLPSSSSIVGGVNLRGGTTIR